MGLSKGQFDAYVVGESSSNGEALSGALCATVDSDDPIFYSTNEINDIFEQLTVFKPKVIITSLLDGKGNQAAKALLEARVGVPLMGFEMRGSKEPGKSHLEELRKLGIESYDMAGLMRLGFAPLAKATGYATSQAKQ